MRFLLPRLVLVAACFLCASTLPAGEESCIVEGSVSRTCASSDWSSGFAFDSRVRADKWSSMEEFDSMIWSGSWWILNRFNSNPPTGAMLFLR